MTRAHFMHQGTALIVTYSGSFVKFLSRMDFNPETERRPRFLLTWAGGLDTLDSTLGEDMANMSTARSQNELFPIFLSTEREGPLAAMAARAETVGEGYLTEFRAMRVRGVLNRSVSKRRLSMTYSINPYRGCEFGCRYCYARYTHEFLAPAGDVPAQMLKREGGPEREGGQGRRSGPSIDLRQPEAFERRIFLKQNAPWLLEQELRRVQPGEEIALGTATDPYQPAERWARITRGILEVFAARSGYRLGIVTKSQLIERDVDLLAEIARRNTLVVHVTITTADVALARKLEPRAPRPDLRFAAVRQLRSAGIVTGVLCSPLLPGITDTEDALDGVARRAAAARASFFAAQPLFLKPCSRPTYLSFVREHFPALEAEYAAQFGGADFVSKGYRERMEVLVERVRRRYALGRRSTDALLTRVLDGERRPIEKVRGMPEQLRLA